MNDTSLSLPSQDVIENWFRALEDCVRAVDYASARGIFAPDVIAFGTYAEVVEGLDNLQRNQWSNVWPKIRDFSFDLAQLHWGWSGAGGWAVVTWNSTGFRPDGAPFARPGRATVLFRQDADRVVAIHTHFSLAPVATA